MESIKQPLKFVAPKNDSKLAVYFCNGPNSTTCPWNTLTQHSWPTSFCKTCVSQPRDRQLVHSEQ